MSAKIISVRGATILLALALFAAGCTPAGPRALLKGKKYLEAGDYPAAVAQLKTATTLLATNAAAWNYYGVALQCAGQPDEAVTAYNRALDLDRELLEARMNLGTLYLEQNQAESARAQFTAYTLRRPNDANGWLKLGAAQLKAGEVVSAERSFSSVLSLKTSEAEAYNGLGLARLQRSKPREAVQFFAAAVQAQPDFAPALLNIAIVSQQQLRDNRTALEYFKKYLALAPPPENWKDVNAIVQSMESAPAQPVVAAAAPPPAVAVAKPVPAQPAPVTAAETKPQPKPVTASAPKPNLSPRAQAEVKPVPVVSPPQVVQVAPETQIVAKPATAVPEDKNSKPGFFQRLFGSSPAENLPTNSGYAASGVTPLPNAPAASSVLAKPAAAPKPAPVVLPPSPVNFPSYGYRASAVPAAGDRRVATAVFNQARQAEQEMKPAAALAAYQQAAQLDPAWFEAQYNAAVLAQRQGDNAAALASYEKALALKPDSADARYNFALALRSGGYIPDAAAELRKVLAAKPNEVRAHLALANLCAQNLHDPAQARKHYQKVLELDPGNPRAADIHFWLAANPG